MKTIKFLIAVLLFVFVGNITNAQQSDYFYHIQKEIDIAKELYVKGKYVSCIKQFEDIQGKLDIESELYAEAEYYKAVALLKSGDKRGYEVVNSYIDNYTESPYLSQALFNLGKKQFEKKQYRLVLKTYGRVNKEDLSDDEQIEMQFQEGFAYLETGDTETAYREFSEIKNADNLYSRGATYYCAHIQYANGDYDAALEDFRALNNDPTYSKVIPLYVSHIYYKQEKYNDVVNYTSSIIDDVPEEYRSELSKITGDSYFHLQQYKNAIPYLETNFKQSKSKTREDNYVMGFCYYRSGRYKEAAELLQKASAGEDEMAQNAYYHLADCYIKLGDKENAKTAFYAASEFDFDTNIKEDALFSYAKLTYELSYSPFNETIKAFDRYISEYPNSEKNTEAYEILVDVYMVTKNYKDAISSIDKIKNKTPNVLKAYQRVTYFRAVELFNNADYNQSIEYFDKSLGNGSYDSAIKVNALYWKSEALYRIGDYGNAVTSYNNYLNETGNSKQKNVKADYNMGYAYLKTGNNDEAFEHFSGYVANMQGKREATVADAYNRIGDYYFLKTAYSNAIANYKKAYEMKLAEADYALLQIAFCQGLEHKQQVKIDELNSLLREYPESDYKDDALYELGRANERLGNSYDAVNEYQQIVKEYPDSKYYRKALLQLGLINYNNGDYNKALGQYKEVAENYKGTSEAKSALLGIKNCYVEKNNVNAYFRYVDKLGGEVTVSASEQDQLTYGAAERLYMAGAADAKTQMEDYLARFPNGAYMLNAKFYLGEIAYKQEDYQTANQYYSFVANQSDNVFTEQALSKASELTYNAENYQDALVLFNRLETKAGDKWNALRANTGQMRCCLMLKDYKKAIVAAKKVNSSDVANESYKKEANYTIGKSNYEIGSLNTAIAPLRDAAKDTKLEQGAEAKYLLAEVYYKTDNKVKSEQEILSFIDMGTPYTYWLGKAFLLLASIYEDNGDPFQAKHTLKSLAENYNDDYDGIKAEAQQRLAVILEKEAKQQQNAVDSSFQMEIKQN